MYNKCLLIVAFLLACLVPVQAAIQIQMSDAASVWWLAVSPQNDGQATTTIEVKDSLSSSFSTMTANPAWGYYTSAPPAGRAFSVPLVLRITSSSGAQISVTVPTITPGQQINTGASFGAVANPTTVPGVAATSRPTIMPPYAAASRPSASPTSMSSSAPTPKPTTATTTTPNNNLCAVTPAVTEPLRLLVPLYVYPGAAWDSVIASANQGVHVIAVINPNSGPLQTVDNAYSTYMTNLKNAGVELVGYVHTSYGARSIDDVKADIDTWVSKYPLVNGIFLDEAAADSSQLPYYSQAYNYVMSKYGYKHTILNPGIVPDQEYLAISTNIVVYEDYASSINNVNSYPSWVKCAPSAAQKSSYKYKFSGIVHTASAADQADIISRLSSSGIGLVYVTDGLGGCCTYNKLTTFLSAEAASIKLLNA